MTVSRPLLELPTGRSRSAGIDLLRGVLAVAVLSTHLFYWGQVTGNSSGLAVTGYNSLLDIFQPRAETHPAVVAFIVLSGYCIHRNGLRRSECDVSAYGIRRFFRIVPVYLLAVAAGVAGFAYVHRANPALGETLTSTYSVTGHCLAAKVTGVAAFYPSGYRCSLQGNPPLATVMVEIWLYAVYALVCVLLLKRLLTDRQLMIGVALIWIVGMVWVSAHPGDAAWWDNGSLFGFLAYWWVGVKFTDPSFARATHRRLLVILLGWAALTFLITREGAYSTFLIEGRKMLFALAIGVLIVWLDNLATGRFELPGRLGQAGYSVYAFHAPIMIALLIAGVPWFVVGVAGILAGLFSFRFFERPLNRVGRRLVRRRQASSHERLATPALGRATP